ncbi:hypothetical protein FGG78_38880 [Thioclava sp. BHET1]|nr:hypothetical protein FGG78_38880 [Thioclava sp. BHET1]
MAGNGVATIASGNFSASFEALAQNNAVVDYRIGSTIAQSGVVSPIVLTTSQNYVSNSSVTSGVGGTTSTSLETGTVDTGISIHALPRLIGKSKIQLDLTILNNQLTKLDNFTSGDTTLQLPTVDERSIENDSVLRPGETLILSGYEQETASKDDAGTGSSSFFGLGGGRKASHQKVRMIVLVRPSIIPLGGS